MLPLDTPIAGGPVFSFTFGKSETETEWTDRRSLSWDDLVKILTSHEPGRKTGPCIVPAVFSGTARKKTEAVQIDVAFLDSDTGVPLEQIVAAVKARGWTAAVSSTHSHMTRRTEVSEANWDRFFRENPGSDPEDYLREKKGYRADVARGATTAETIGDLVQVDHQPCPKHRVAIPLARPWLASAYPSQAAANAAWKSAVEALAHALDLPHDQSCTDTSRLFYLPRRPPRGAPPETEVVTGHPCDIWSLAEPPAEMPDLLNERPATAERLRSPSSEPREFVDRETGEVVDLTDWARTHGRGFLIAAALRKRCPDVLTGLVVDNKVHIRCPNDGQHTHPGQDGATFVCDAGASETKGFLIHCRHAHCTDKDRLFFIGGMLAAGWLCIDDLTAAEFQIMPNGHTVITEEEWRAIEETAPDDPPPDWQWGKTGATGPAARWAVPLDIFSAHVETPAQVTAGHVPSRLWPFVYDTSLRMGVDTTSVALGCIVTCAAAIHDDWQVQPKRNDRTWTESARLWGCIVGDPSTLKSPVVMACTRIIDRLEAESRRRHEDEMDHYEKAHALWKKDKGTEVPEPVRPKVDRYLVEGATMEAFGEVLRSDKKAQQRAKTGKVLCRQDEMSEWAGNLDRYGGKGGGDRGAYLRLYNGGRYTIDRIGRGHFAISNWSACFLTGCQPEPIQKIAKDAAEDGLLQRFMYAVPAPSTEGLDQVEDEAAIDGYHGIVRALTAMHPLTRDNGYGHEHVVFHEYAHVHREAIDKAARALAGMPGTSNRVKSTLGKWPGLYARLCLTFHLIEHAGTQLGFRYVIPEATAETVKNYMLEIILPHLIRADALMFLTPQTGHARWIAGHILAKGAETITTREIVHASRALRSPEQSRELTSTMGALVSIGWLDPMPPRNPLNPVNAWRVNPEVHVRFAAQAARETEAREASRRYLAAGAAHFAMAGFAENEQNSYN